MVHITIDGNIGAGKTTVLTKLEGSDGFDIQYEPISDWTMFEKFYKAPVGIASTDVYAFETEVQMTRTSQVLESAGRNAIFERSPFLQTYCFSTIAYKNKQLTQQQYDNLMMHAKVLEDFMKDSFRVYIDVPVDVCVQRIMQRNRKGEERIERSLLEKIEKAYKQFDYDLVIFGELKTSEEIAEIIRRKAFSRARDSH